MGIVASLIIVTIIQASRVSRYGLDNVIETIFLNVSGAAGLFTLPLSQFSGSLFANLDLNLKIFLYVLIIIAWAFIPLMVLLSRGIPKHRRIPYIYIVATYLPIIFKEIFTTVWIMSED